jgi:hypothetical protein
MGVAVASDAAVAAAAANKIVFIGSVDLITAKFRPSWN